MKSDKRRWYVPTVAAAVLVYQIVFPRPLGRELLVQPVWSVPAGGAPEAAPAGAPAEVPEPREEALRGYRLDGHLGYVDRGGSILFREKIVHGAAVHDDYFIPYTSLPRSLAVRGADGGFLGIIPESGYPFISGNRLFLFSVDGFSLSEWTVNGEKIWARSFPSLITAMDAGSETAALGFLDGGFRVIGKEGEEIFSPPRPESRHPVTLLAGVGGDDRFVATVQGINPQTLSVFERSGRNYRLLDSRALPSDYRRPVKGGFFTPGFNFVVEQPGGVGVFIPREKRFTGVALPGVLRGLAENTDYHLLFALTEEGERFFLTAFLPSGKKALQFAFPRDASHFIRKRGSGLLMGLGSRLFQIAVRTG